MEYYHNKLSRRQFLVTGAAAMALYQCPALAAPLFVVSSTTDSSYEGSGSLRAAIEAANASGGGEIVFDLPSGSTITPQAPLPELRYPVTIGGPVLLDFSAAGGEHGLTIAGDGSRVHSLSITGAAASGLRLTGPGGGSTVEGVTAIRCGTEGLSILGSPGNRVTDCAFHHNGRYNVVVGAGPLAADTRIERCTFGNAARSGLLAYNVPRLAALDCRFVRNTRSGVTIDGSLIPVALTDPDVAPYVQWLGQGYANSCRVGRSVFYENGLRGVLIYYAQAADIFENRIVRCKDGIDIIGPRTSTDPLIQARGNRLRANEIIDSARYGIARFYDEGTMLANNIVTGSGTADLRNRSV